MSQPSKSVGDIVALPYSSNIGRGPEGALQTRLSILSEMSITAAAVLWQGSPESSIVIPGETGFPLEFPNTTELMSTHAVKAAVDPDKIIGLSELADGRHLNNTFLQAQAVADYLAVRPEAARRQETLVLALDYHAVRVQRVCRAYGIVARCVMVESVLRRDSKLHDAYADYLPYLDAIARVEPVLRAMSFVDPKGRILNAVTRRRGARVVDINLLSDGSYEIEDKTANEKYAEVMAEAS